MSAVEPVQPRRRVPGPLASAMRASSAPIVLMAGATVLAAGVHGFAGEPAAAGYWAVVAPPGLAYVAWRARRLGDSQRTTLVVVVLVAVTFAAGGVFGSITAADVALGCVLAALGAGARARAAVAGGGAIAASALALGVAGAAPAWTALSTGLWLLATGLLLRG